MASPRRLLRTTALFDDAVTNHALFIIDTVMAAANPSKIIVFHMYQDFTTDRGKADSTKSVIVKSRYCADDLTGFSEPVHRRHFIRSRVYKQLADERTLAYFNKIIFQS